jgi:hypothetical protein
MDSKPTPRGQQRRLIGVAVNRALVTLCAGVSTLALTAAAGGARGDQWRPLRRPLHLPKLATGVVCPVSRVDPRVPWKRINIFGGSGIGRGPVYPGLSNAFLWATRDQQYGGPWFGEKVFWYVSPAYRGRVLIRGRRLDGPQMMGFNGRRLPAPELRIETGQTVSWQGQPNGSRGVPSGVRIRAAGCYGVQIDGTKFSRVVVFRADIVS